MNQRQHLEQLLIEKAMKDEVFRKQLIDNPVAVIENETGMKIPEAFHIKILEEDPQTVFLILPSVSGQGSEMELSEEELESISGGNDLWSKNLGNNQGPGTNNIGTLICQ